MKTSHIMGQGIDPRDLPTLPAVACKVLSLTAEEAIDGQAITQAISTDVSLASRILKVVNSPLYGFRYPISTIDKAISLMGSNALRGLVLSFSLVGLKDSEKESGFDYDRFWEKSLMTAVLSRFIAQHGHEIDPEEAFLAGLVANIGEMLIARLYPEGRREESHLCEIGGSGRSSDIDHGEFGAAAALFWNFPPALCQCIRCHQDPQRCKVNDPQSSRLVEVVHLAELLAELLSAQELQREDLEKIRILLAVMNLDDESLKKLAPVVQEELRIAAQFFGLNTPPQLSAAQILEEANFRLGKLFLDGEIQRHQLEVATAQFSLRNECLEEQNVTLEEMANIDGLTGVYNHRYFQSFLLKELKRSARLGHCLSLILADVDDFKPLNDSYGHLAGDAILKEFCRVLRSEMREYDLMARYGGEEFAFVLPNTSRKEAQVIAERIRLIVEGHVFTHETHELSITVSLGVSTLCPDPDSKPVGSFLVGAADRALLQAKAQGKNQVVAGRP